MKQGDQAGVVRAAALVGVLSLGLSVQETQDQAFGLESFYDAGPVLEDRNGDGHLDYVRAHVVITGTATPRTVSAAANVAGRLGYETMSLDLPMSVSRGGPAISVGSSGSTGDGLDLEPGEGVIAVQGTDGSILVTGADDAGVSAAALVLASRLPYVWDTDGITYHDVADSVARVLGSARITRVLVDAEVSGLRRVDVAVNVTETSLASAVQTLSNLAAADSAPPLRFDGLRLLRVNLVQNGTVVGFEQIANPDANAEDASGGRPGGGDKEDLKLSTVMTNDGFLGDSDRNLIPDRVDVILSPAEPAGGATVDLAARIALEATGVSIPIAIAPDDLDDPESMAPLVLIGRSHPLIDTLVAHERLRLPTLAAGEGWIEAIPDAFEDKSAFVVIGGDERGLERAVRQLAERIPHLWSRGKDHPTVADVEHDLWMGLSGRSPVGQAGAAVYKLDQILSELPDDAASVDIEVFVEHADSGLSQFLVDRTSSLRIPRTVNVGTIDVQAGDTIISEEIDIPSEVDALWTVVREQVIPRVGGGAPVYLVAGVSESPEIRARLEEEITSALLDAGSSLRETRVTVLSAYKQGYSWLHDVVRPEVEGLALDSLIIRFAEIGPPEEWPQQAMYTKTRWLLELFPIDEILSRDIGLPLDRIKFEMMPIGSPTYDVRGIRGGVVVYREHFEPRVVLRPFFDRFPDYEHARVTTGWVTATTGDDMVIVDERIATDLETFWDYFQSNTLDQLYRQVMSISDGAPRAGDAPHFGELRIDVTLSEPDYQLGVDQEQIAPMEALHEEIYFATLHFFDVMGRLARGQPLAYPGRVIPIVRPKSDGHAGSARITLTGFGADAPMVRVRYQRSDGREVIVRRDIPTQTLDKPSILSGGVRVGTDGFASLGARVKVNFGPDQRAAFVQRTSQRRVDAGITFAEQVSGIIDRISELRTQGVYESALAYEGLGALNLSAWWGHTFDPDSVYVATLPENGTPALLPRAADLRASDYRWTGDSLVQWDTPIPPPEAFAILSRMDTFDEATMYRVGTSYLGKDVWALDVMAPLDGAYWSQAKATALKPTVVYSARQHANEVSSTSHTLRLAEHILTDPAFAHVLDRVNVVFHPITNADGAQLAYDLYRITPNHMLHAGYLGSLGVDVTSGASSDDPIYPETRIRPKIWRTWLPDIFLNPHGYPSHEWVQPFSEYAGWVRTRTTEQRGWWGMRGWFMPGFGYTDSEEFPHHKAAAWEIRDRITSNINALPDIRALNRRAYDRHRRYGYEFDPDVFKRAYSDSVLIYTSLTGSTGEGGGVMNNPRVTIWSGTTEAPDETASGEWLQLVASAGLAWDRALLDYLVEGDHEIKRSRDPFAGGVALKVVRPRPAGSGEDEDTSGN